MNRNRLLALARKTLDESTPEPERITSGNMLAKEIVKLLADVETDPFAAPLDAKDQADADRANRVVQQAVRKAAINEQPESEKTQVEWVDFDPPAPASPSPFGDNAFGRKPRARR